MRAGIFVLIGVLCAHDVHARDCNAHGVDIPERRLLQFARSAASCPLIPDQPARHEGLSPLWAQEMIGSDLIGESTGAQERPLVGIYDAGFSFEKLPADGISDELLRAVRAADDRFLSRPVSGEKSAHGNPVCHLVLGRSKYGTGSRAARIDLLSYGHFAPGVAVFGESPSRDGRRLVSGRSSVPRNPPHVINASREIKDYDLPFIAAIHANGGLVIAASGNDYPRDRANEGRRVISVGSLTPEGLISEFSAEADSLTLYAPSNFELLATRDGVRPAGFGGTSGAAPLVSGAMTHAVELLGRLTHEEAVELLQRSGFRRARVSSPRHPDQVIQLNLYRLREASKRLAGLGFSDHPRGAEERLALLRDPSVYDFSAAVRGNLEQVAKSVDEEDCTELKSAWIAMRRAFLLHPSPMLGEAIARVYEAAGFEVNARYYREFHSPSLERLERQWSEARREETPGRAAEALRNARVFHGAAALPLLRRAWRDSDSYFLRQRAVYELSQAGDSGVEALVAGFRSRRWSRRLRSEAVFAASQSGTRGKPIIEYLLDECPAGERDNLIYNLAVHLSNDSPVPLRSLDDLESLLSAEERIRMRPTLESAREVARR